MWSLLRSSVLSSSPRQLLVASSSFSSKGPPPPSGKGTALLLLNMGGPAELKEVGPFLKRLFQDRDILQLPLQDTLGAWIASRRTPAITQKYSEIGGGSPILAWTEKQGALLSSELDRVSPSTAPHSAYVGFRYAPPLTHHTLQKMEEDGVGRAVAFSQYPHYSCATSGSSIHAIHKFYGDRGGKSSIKWSVLDRWGTNPGLVSSIVARIREQIPLFPPEQGPPVILFSAHSLPMKAVNRGDPYPVEVSATVELVMQELGHTHPYRLVWQSKVGPVPWLRPSTEEAIKGLAAKKMRNILLVPIAFVNEHIETLHEMDIEYGSDLAKEVGVTVRRAAAPNDHPAFISGMAETVKSHLTKGVAVSPQLLMTCPLCTRDTCRKTKGWLHSLNATKK